MTANTKHSKFLYLECVLGLLIVFLIYSQLKYQEDIVQGLLNILSSSSLLVSDYLAIGGLSATLLNVILVLSLNLLIIKRSNLTLRGSTFAAVFTVIGFSFFGKNIINILPIYLGVFLLAKIEEDSFKKYFVIAMFATGLSPSVSFGFDSVILNNIIGVIFGVIYGFIIPAFSAHVISFHRGYTLYNIGFAGGVIALLIYGVLTLFGIEFDLTTTTTFKYSLDLKIFLFIISTLYLIVGIVKHDSDKSYKKLLSMSGRAITDFIMIFGEALTFKNIGLLGYLSLLVMLITKVQINGVIFGAALTVIGFGAFGKHIKNVIPIIVGVLLVGLFQDRMVTPTIMTTALFATTLAPIAGDFGFIVGTLAGVFHVGVASRSTEWQGGMNLYNNGFASGFVAAFISSLHDTYEQHKYKLKRGNNNETS